MKFRNIIFSIFLSLVSFTVFAGNFQTFNPAIHEKIDGKYAMKNQLLVAMRPTAGDSTKSLQQFNSALKANGLNVTNSEVISSSSAKIQIIKVNVGSGKSYAASANSIENMPNVEWVQPNYVYNINVDPREDAAPNDPMLEKQYHHALMGNIKAWDISTGSNVLVAVTDDGFDTSHEDLKTRFNSKGYNFCNDNNDVTPKGWNGEHGTHVAGIVAAELNNGIGGAGTAGNANVMPIKFYGDCNWTSEMIYKAYTYSADNGAKIMSTSYNVDQFVGDKTFISALDYVYEKGVLHFNSAGNNGQKNPPRAAFDQLVLVVSTNEKDQKSSFSNYGDKVQISAPGEDILSTVPNNKYDTMSGTSMATPNAAGSAALIWSAHPAWNRDQVAAQLIGTADNIDDINPEYKGLLGSGRINNYRALTEEVKPVKVTYASVGNQTAIPGSNAKSVVLSVHFDKLLDPAVVNSGKHWVLKSLDKNGTIVPTEMKHKWFTGSMLLELVVPEIKPGKYQLTVKDSLKDPFGQSLDGKATGKAGGNYTFKFTIA